MTKIEELEKRIKLTKELIELQKLLNELIINKPHNPSPPYIPPYTGTPWVYPDKVWCGNSLNP